MSNSITIERRGNYATLDSLAAGINEAHEAATAAARTAIDHARRCGELLRAAKAQLPHGEFLPWLTKNCQTGERQARNYMRIAEHWERIGKTAPGSDLTIKQALRLTRDEPPKGGTLHCLLDTIAEEITSIDAVLPTLVEKWLGGTRESEPPEEWLREYRHRMSGMMAEFFNLQGWRAELIFCVEEICRMAAERLAELTAEVSDAN